MYITETERISALLDAAGEPSSVTHIAEQAVSQWLSSPALALMQTAERYYRGENDILRRRRLVIGEHGQLTEDTNLSNYRVPHTFLRKLVDQKADYLFGRPFSIVTSSDAYTRALETVFDHNLRRKMKNLCKEAVNKGIAWLMPYFDERGIHFCKIPSEQVIPLWHDDEHETLDAVVRVYEKEYDRGGRTEKRTHAEYYDVSGVRHYVYRNGKLQFDASRGVEPHFMYGGKPYCFTRVPFIPLRYNEEELPLIRFVKALIDDYDLIKSDDTNDLSDNAGDILVIRNYDGQDLGEFRRNLRQFKAVKVIDDGGLDIKRTEEHTDSRLAHLLQDRKDLFEAARGVDTQSERYQTLSGVALRFLYADLDLDASGIETEFLATFEAMCFFIGIWLRLSGAGDFSGDDARVILNRDMLINEAEAIESCERSLSLLSKRTVLENHPWVTDAVKESARIEAEGE